MWKNGKNLTTPCHIRVESLSKMALGVDWLDDRWCCLGYAAAERLTQELKQGGVVDWVPFNLLPSVEEVERDTGRWRCCCCYPGRCGSAVPGPMGWRESWSGPERDMETQTPNIVNLYTELFNWVIYMNNTKLLNKKKREQWTTVLSYQWETPWRGRRIVSNGLVSKRNTFETHNWE